MKEVIILGKGPSRVECPYNHETWAVNDSYDFAKRIDKLFLTDAWSEFSTADLRRYHRRYGYRLVCATVHPDVADIAEPYPIEDVLRECRTVYFSNTIAYMFGYAILHKYERVWLYGIDCLNYTTYVNERGSIEHLWGIALGRGIEVRNTRLSATGKTFNGRLYGFWGDREGAIKAVSREIRQTNESTMPQVTIA